MPNPVDPNKIKKFNLIVCGGTFDHFHEGHKEFLRFQLNVSSKVLIGLTSDNYVLNTKKEGIQTYKEREDSILHFLRSEGKGNQVEITKINSLFIPQEWEKRNIEAIACTSQTKRGVLIINKERKKRNLKCLKILLLPLIKADDGKNITSTRIRNGEIDREGNCYQNINFTKRDLFITLKLRNILNNPFGFLIKDYELWIKKNKINPVKTITVGDVITSTFIKYKIKQHISVIDLKIARKKMFRSYRDHGFPGKVKLIKIINPPGTITVKTMKESFSIFDNKHNIKQIVIQIDGEEDLMVLPLLLAAPLGFTIFYGQPGLGVVKVTATETTKHKAYSLIKAFSTKRTLSSSNYDVTRGH